MATRKKRYVIVYEGSNKPPVEAELNRLEADGYHLQAVIPGCKLGRGEYMWPAYVMELSSLRRAIQSAE